MKPEKSKTIQQIKEAVAREEEFDSFKDAMTRADKRYLVTIMERVAYIFSMQYKQGKLAGYLFEGRFYESLDNLKNTTMHEHNHPVPVYYSNKLPSAKNKTVSIIDRAKKQNKWPKAIRVVEAILLENKSVADLGEELSLTPARIRELFRKGLRVLSSKRI